MADWSSVVQFGLDTGFVCVKQCLFRGVGCSSGVGFVMKGVLCSRGPEGDVVSEFCC